MEQLFTALSNAVNYIPEFIDGVTNAVTDTTLDTIDGIGDFIDFIFC